MKTERLVGVTVGCFGLLLVGLGILHARGKAQTQTSAACSVQLIRASNDEKPGRFGPVGNALQTQFSRIFQWQRFWEVNRKRVRVLGGELTKLRLSPDCEVEIEPVSPSVRETRIYLNGVLASRTRQNVQRHAPTIHGAATDESGAWFVVVEEEEEQADE